jgi:glutamyl-tRNA reductase
VLLCITANHQNASFEMLEKLSIGTSSAAATLIDRSDVISGAVVLATCNRFEAYLEIDEPLNASNTVALESAVGIVSEVSGVSADELRSAVSVKVGTQVVNHLFSVSSGLESVVVGEDEISGQVRRALEKARVDGTTTSGLEQLFQKASTTSRGVKTRTAIGGAGRSLVRLGLEMASSRIVDWAETRVLIVGTGQYAATTLAALRDRGVTDLTVFSPSGRAERFALKHAIVSSVSLPDAVADADLVITCTSSETPVLTAELVAPGRRRLVMDLGLPRNVDPAIAAVDGIELLDLETISLHAPVEELTAASQAREMVGQATAEFIAREAEQKLAPAIVALRTHVFDLLESEIDRARARGDEDGKVEAALRHLTGVLLHTPSVRARELARSGDGASFSEAVAALFGVEVAPPTEPEAEQRLA